MAVPTGRLKKVAAVPIIVKSDPVIVEGKKGEKGEQGEKGWGLPGKDGKDGRDAPKIDEILEALLKSPALLELVNKELGKLPAGIMGGSGRMDVQDLPGYRGASSGQVFGILDSGKAGFFDIGTVDVAEYTRLIDTDGTYKYVGEATPGTTSSESLWRIKRAAWTSEDDWEILWADGVSDFTKVWDDRLTYSYS